MKINSVQQSDIVSRYMNSATNVPQKVESTRTVSNDSVELSTGAQNYAQLIKDARGALETSETNEDTRANEIMEQINSGTYSVSTDSVLEMLTGAGDMPSYS